MTATEWQAVRALFNASLDAPAELRPRLLAEANVPEIIRAEAARLLTNLDQASDAFLAAPTFEPRASLTIGEHLGPYEIVALIGAGGMGEVYKARDTRLDRMVAIKVSKAEFNQRFEQEARAVAALNHPNICQLYDVGPNYLVMELIEGAPLAPTGILPTLLDQAIQITDGLSAAHAQGITHRDLKPGNILVTLDATGASRVRILDFGIAQQATDATGPTSSMGTPAYLSPEQIRGQKVDGRSDLWSLGIILYEMATGTRPFEGPKIVEEILNKSFVPVRDRNPKIPAGLERIIARLLEKDRENRYPSAAALRAELKRVASPRSTLQWRLGMATAAILAAAVGGYFSIRQIPARVPPADFKPATSDSVIVATPPTPAPPEAPPPITLTNKDVLVLADFTNTTGDPEFDRALRQALAARLDDSPFLKIMDDKRMRDQLKLMGRPATQRITNETAREICIREDQKAMIEGFIAALGKTYAITLEASNCQSGASLAREQVSAPDKEHVLDAIARATEGIRAKLGESLTSIQVPRHLEEVTTSSLEAYQAFSLANETESIQGPLAAIPLYQHVLEIDPNFVMAYWRLGLMYRNSGNAQKGNENLEKAFALIDKVPVTEHERFRLTLMHYVSLRPDAYQKEMEVAKLYAQKYPRDPAPHNQMGMVYMLLGDWNKALGKFQDAIQREPREPVFYNNALGMLRALNRIDEAKALAQQAFANNVAPNGIHTALLIIAFIQGDDPAIQKEIAALAGTDAEYVSFQLQAGNAEYRGQQRQAAELHKRSAELARRLNITVTGQVSPLSRVIEGDCEQVAKQPFLLALCGDAAAGQKLIEASINPSDDGILYLRARDLFNAGKATEAATIFQRILDHRTAYWNLLYPLSYIGLAHAQLQAGDTAKARRAYQSFLTLWKDADKDLPLYVQASRELAGLPSAP